MPLLPPLPDESWPPELADLLQGFAGRLNVYRVMAHHPALVRAWSNLRNHLVLANSLSPQEQEIVILRTGRRWDSAYEWAHHVVRGREAGLSDLRIARTGSVPQALDGAHPDDLLMQCVDELLDHGQLSELRREALMAQSGAAGVLDLMATVGMYSTLAFILKTFETPIEPEVARAAETLEA